MSQRRLNAAMLAGVALAGCAGAPDIAVRAVGAPLGVVAGGDQLALARASLALGNVGQALQQFRLSLRANPTSTEALSGIAHCYDAMGRGDLSRRYFQEALALAPADTRLLARYADALARQGATAEAEAVVREIALRTKGPAVQWVIEPAQTVSVDAARAVEAPAAPAPRAPSPVALAADEPVPARKGARTARLERLSLGEVALVTTAVPLWRTLPTPTSATRQIALAANAPLPTRLASAARSVRLLNAARLQGLAARHAGQLREAGWRRLTIGDASKVRAASLILYPAGRDGEARRLAASLRISAVRAAPRSDILVLLGRDRG